MFMQYLSMNVFANKNYITACKTDDGGQKRFCWVAWYAEIWNNWRFAKPIYANLHSKNTVSSYVMDAWDQIEADSCFGTRFQAIPFDIDWDEQRQLNTRIGSEKSASTIQWVDSLQHSSLWTPFFDILWEQTEEEKEEDDWRNRRFGNLTCSKFAWRLCTLLHSHLHFFQMKLQKKSKQVNSLEIDPITSFQKPNFVLNWIPLYRV